MKRIITIIFLAIVVLSVHAQTILDSLPYVTIYQDSMITKLVESKIKNAELIETETDGFRVQVFSSNNHQSAKNEALQMEKYLLEQVTVKVYVNYFSPFWKVRLGDFRTYEEAQAFKEELIKQLPELQGESYIVKDKIQVLQ